MDPEGKGVLMPEYQLFKTCRKFEGTEFLISGRG
jgi:hypothetical protein